MSPQRGRRIGTGMWFDHRSSGLFSDGFPFLALTFKEYILLNEVPEESTCWEILITYTPVFIY